MVMPALFVAAKSYYLSPLCSTAMVSVVGRSESGEIATSTLGGITNTIGANLVMMI